MSGKSEKAEDDFQALVAASVNALPPHIRAKIKNVAFLLDTAEGGNLLGLYHGLPNPFKPYVANSPPDTITIYQRVIEAEAESRGESISRAVRRVVWHEVGHYFGFGEKKIRELERRWEKDGKLE